MKCMWVEGNGTVSLAFHQGVDGEIDGRVSKFPGVVRDGNERDRHHGPGHQAAGPKSIQGCSPTQKEPGQQLKRLR